MNQVMNDIGRPFVSEDDAKKHFDENPKRRPKPPVPTGVEVEPACLEGYTYSYASSFNEQLSFFPQYPINVSEGSVISSPASLQLAPTRIVLNQDHSASFFRSQGSNGFYYSFLNSGWTSNENGEVSIHDIQFANEVVSLKLGAIMKVDNIRIILDKVINIIPQSPQIDVRVMDRNSFGPGDVFQRQFRSSPECGKEIIFKVFDPRSLE